MIFPILQFKPEQYIILNNNNYIVSYNSQVCGDDMEPLNDILLGFSAPNKVSNLPKELIENTQTIRFYICNQHVEYGILQCLLNICIYYPNDVL